MRKWCFNGFSEALLNPSSSFSPLFLSPHPKFRWKKSIYASLFVGREFSYCYSRKRSRSEGYSKVKGGEVKEMGEFAHTPNNPNKVPL